MILNNFAKKRDEIIVCPSPLLFCALTAEFLIRISGTSLHHQHRCLAASELFKELGIKIEDAIKDEEELKYYLHQADSTGRNTLGILAKNGFFNMLENDEIGTIVTKMWIGPNMNYGILGASTIYKAFHSPAAAEEELLFTQRLDAAKPYMFHYEQWLESCSLRFTAQGVSTSVLVFLYQMLIYTAISEESVGDVTRTVAGARYFRLVQI